MPTEHKRAAMELIDRMPDDVSLEEIMYRLYFRKRVERGIKELEEGKTVSQAEMKRSLQQWLRSAGQ